MTLDIAIDRAVAAAHPDYRALVVIAEGVTNAPSDAESQAVLRQAEAARAGLARAADLPHLAAWRAAFSAFGAKPSKYPSSAEALIGRIVKGGELPRVNRLVDLYNAISVLHAIPVGGEDLDRAVPPMRLIHATGEEPFDPREDGADPEHPSPGEVVWADAQGVTCRRWNWRQCARTQLTAATKRAYFLFDALEPCDDEALRAAAGELAARLRLWHPDAAIATVPVPHA